MNLFYLRYFVTLAHVKHYTKAAQQLCITQPSLSHAINQLEKELHLPLFEKNGRNTTLTRYGEEFLACAEQTLATLDAGVASLEQSARGSGLIRIGMLRILGVDYIPRLAAEFLRESVGTNVRFSFHTGATGFLLEELVARKHDLVFCSRPPEGSGLEQHAVLRQKLVLITPKDHPLAGRKTIDLKDTLLYPQIFFSKGAGLRSVIEAMFQKIGKMPEVAYETEEDQVIAGMVANGFGIAVVPYMDILPRLNLKILPISYPEYERMVFMVHDSRIFMAPAVRRFMEFVQSKGIYQEQEETI